MGVPDGRKISSSFSLNAHWVPLYNIHKLYAELRDAYLEGNQSWNKATFFLDSRSKNRSISIGGNSVREHFHPTNDFSSMFHSEQENE
jgi:hypothetical protein